MPFVGDFLARGLLPEHLSGLPVEAHDGELVHLVGFLPGAGSARPTSSSGSARPAELWGWQRGIQPFMELLVGKRAAACVPIREPFCEPVLEFLARERAVLVGVGGAKESG